jgi:hypothetical protein
MDCIPETYTVYLPSVLARCKVTKKLLRESADSTRKMEHSLFSEAERVARTRYRGNIWQAETDITSASHAPSGLLAEKLLGLIGFEYLSTPQLHDCAVQDPPIGIRPQVPRRSAPQNFTSMGFIMNESYFECAQEARPDPNNSHVRLDGCHSPFFVRSRISHALTPR